MKKTRDNIYLAAILHGIKPFYQFAENADRTQVAFIKECTNLLETDNKDGFDYSLIIKKASILASGGIEYTAAENTAGGNCLLKPILQTVLSGNLPLETYYIPTTTLSLSKKCFPSKEIQGNVIELRKRFAMDLDKMKTFSVKAFAETLLNLSMKYTWCLPADHNNQDVPLYDYVKITAAISVCLYDVHVSCENPEAPFLLIGGDVSGIQKYIYQVVSKYAGKNLKGRSFYVKLLTDAIVRYIIKELDLYSANVIYNSGGGFYILAPNVEKVRTKLTMVIGIIEKKLFETYKTSLYVAIESVEIDETSLMHKGLQDKWSELFIKKDRKKFQSQSAIISDNYDNFFTPFMAGGDANQDTITGEEFLPGEKAVKIEDMLLHHTTAEQIKLGQILRDAAIMAVVSDNCNLPQGIYEFNPASLGIRYCFLRKEDLTKLQPTSDISVITLNGKDGQCEFIYDIPSDKCIFELSFYGGNEFNGNTFEEMCDNPGFTRMGVLSMDVDNLGSIFQSGIRPENMTLPRLAALSRQMDFFFSGYINTIWKETKPENTYIVYSGGDDLFIVGKWDCVIELARKIHSDFAEYTCNNRAISISGGIAIVQSKFPLIKAAEESKKEEKNAKYHVCNGKGKDSISFMDVALNWNKEFPAVEKLKNDIVRMLKTNELPKSFISKIMDFTDNAELIEHRITNIKTYWMMTYDLKRLKERCHGNGPHNLIDNCIKEVCGNNVSATLGSYPIESKYHRLELWSLACRWAELETRNEE